MGTNSQCVPAMAAHQGHLGSFKTADTNPPPQARSPWTQSGAGAQELVILKTPQVTLLCSQVKNLCICLILELLHPIQKPLNRQGYLNLNELKAEKSCTSYIHRALQPHVASGYIFNNTDTSTESSIGSTALESQSPVNSYSVHHYALKNLT